ncbi:DUF4255 domain-containing protein [Mucilaginibacter sp. JRF]|uniref:DUF4255 domain-containing protein n=1 Tax=Mucilaginibacter sp. JRF TaxID=2780088 RepID=UPI001880182F|nr:DUF4255 domain-containing protein [Mucilaginibacter sp. JRF]MBE9586616.1 DUF4255 domain-containing protein [Mucilaginibacter sp. JRF]
MIRTALEFLADELNQYLKRKDAANFGNVDCVIVSALMTPEGNFAVTTEGDNVFRVILTLINLEEDRIADSQQTYRKVDDKIQMINPPVNLNAYVLFSVFAANYPTALRLLSYVISFFQTTYVFDSGQYPQMNAKVDADKPWHKLNRLLVSLHPTTFEQQNNLWGAMGAKYMPNVIYKVRTMSFIDMEPKMEAPPITEINISDN